MFVLNDKSQLYIITLDEWDFLYRTLWMWSSILVLPSCSASNYIYRWNPKNLNMVQKFIYFS